MTGPWPKAAAPPPLTPSPLTPSPLTPSPGRTLPSPAATWITEDISPFGNHIRLDGTGYLTPPASAIPTGNNPPKISIWFKTTSTTGGVLVSTQKNPLSSGGAMPSEWDPVLYVGNNSKLYGEWRNGSADPAVSTTQVDDGLWHHAVLTATSTSQTLTLDGVTQQTLSGATSFQYSPANLAFGAGYICGNWHAEPNYKQNCTGSADYRYYLNGEIAAITYSYPGGP